MFGKPVRMEEGLLLDKAETLALYRKLFLARAVEERIRREYSKDEMKTPVHLGIGQEAIPVGVLHALPPGSRTFGTYRNHSLYLTVTEETDRFFGELYGKRTGTARGKAGSMHLSAPEQGLMVTSAVVGATIPVAVGAAFAEEYLQSGRWVAVFFGDGTIEEGVFWESLNFACLRKLRILFVCEDNGLAIHTPARQRQGFRSVPEAVAGFDCHGASGDGSGLLEVISLTQSVQRRMQEDPKPGFLHLSCLRFLEHVGPKEDFDAGYRRRPTPEELERLDPLLRFEKEMIRCGAAPAQMEEIRRQVEEQIERSVRLAQEAPFPDPSELERDLFA